MGWREAVMSGFKIKWVELDITYIVDVDEPLK